MACLGSRRRRDFYVQDIQLLRYSFIEFYIVARIYLSQKVYSFLSLKDCYK